MHIFDTSLAQANTNPKKIYCVDHAMVALISSSVLVNSEYLLESLALTALCRVTPNIFYCKTKVYRKVDFIAGRQVQPRMIM